MSKSVYLLIYSQINTHRTQSRNNIQFGALAANLLSDLFTVDFLLMDAKMVSLFDRPIYDEFNSMT